MSLNITYKEYPVIKTLPIQFESYPLGTHTVSYAYNNAWAVANALTTARNDDTTDEPIPISPIEKKHLMPTWSATRSILMSQTEPRCKRVNTEAIAPLFRSSLQSTVHYIPHLL